MPNSCAKPCPNDAMILVKSSETEDYTLVCPLYYQYKGTCAICANSLTCAFETDPSPLPKAIIQETRQGNMTMQMQVRNPERIKITCAQGCKCYSADGFCERESNTCINCKEEWKNNLLNCPWSQVKEPKAD